jgi:cytochrome c551
MRAWIWTITGFSEGLLWASICLLLFACQNKQEQETNNTKERQYYVQGEKLYLKHCSNCHQKDGSGLGRLFPPLNKSDYLDQNFAKLPCIIRNGIDGELIVNGKQYNQPMRGIPALTDLEIGEIATYLFNNWGREKGLISVQDISALSSKCDPKN